MEHVMVDLETFGRRAGCAIASIGAVGFDPVTKRLGKEFYTVVSRASQKEIAHEDEDTLSWWDKQSEEAHKVITESSMPSAPHYFEALKGLNQYLKGFVTVKVWGNGADFDNAILYHLYAQAGLEPGWMFTNSRCYRTLKNLKPYLRLKRVGTYHNALDDAKTQALHAIELLAILDHVSKTPAVRTGKRR